jgi:hypothetical protein
LTTIASTSAKATGSRWFKLLKGLLALADADRALRIGQPLAFGILGKHSSWAPASDAEANAWTSSYPTKAISPIMALAKSVREGALERFSAPVLVFCNAAEDTMGPEQTKAAIAPLIAAEIYGLEVLKSGMEDAPNNTTRFLILSKTYF